MSIITRLVMPQGINCALHYQAKHSFDMKVLVIGLLMYCYYVHKTVRKTQLLIVEQFTKGVR